MRSEPLPHPRSHRGVAELDSDANGGTRAPAGRPRSTQNNAPTGKLSRSVSHGLSCSHAQRSIPTSRRLPPLPCVADGAHDSDDLLNGGRCGG